ncbi:paired amphipathic helix protein Sin3-like 4 [Zingiber officinale]|uniref:paired amphipathic helix protein Sin3-like 4 n=1 Tax=Zingiber officinale TaxID=94328 RepID=UPI001C4C07E5|nr:paired amphipathic helix protein Sin3-like 4 [Zingiber officinale]
MRGFKDDMDAARDREPKRCRNSINEKPDSRYAKKYLKVLAHSLEVEEYQKFLKIMLDFRDKRFTPDFCFIMYSSNLLSIFVSQRKRKENIHLDAYCRNNQVECVKKVKTLLQGKPDLFLGFQDFLPKSLDAKDRRTCDKMPDCWDALNFIHKIKNRFSDNDHNYSCFLELLNMYHTRRMSIDEVMILFQDHDDLVEEFNYFLFNCSKGVSFSHESSQGLIGQTSTDDSGGKKMFQIKSYTHLQDLEHIERTKQIQRSDEISKGYPFSNTCIQHETNLNSSMLHSDKKAHIPIMEKDTLMDMGGKLSGSVSIKGKYLGVDPLSKGADVYVDNTSFEEEKCQPIRENFSNCQRYDTSYCFLPNNYPVPRASYMTELDASVLNDRLVSVPSKSENCTSKFMHRNKYEKCLFRCDDERFEMDMILCRMASTSQKVEDLLEKVHHNKIEPGTPFQIKNYLNDQDFRCIGQLYGDNGLEVVGFLCANASTVLPVISARLKQKQEEASRKHAEFNKVWSEACAKCYPRSLDHRSFQFKQQDRRNLASSVLLDEYRQINERMEDNLLLESSTGNGHCSPTMVFEYADREIHDVLHKIMEFYCGNYYNSKEEMDNVMRIWTTFLEPIFGVLTWLKDTESSKEKKYNSRSSVSTSAHIDVSLGAKGFVTHLNYSHTSNASNFLTPIGKKNVHNFEKWASVRNNSCSDAIHFHKNAHPSIEIPTDYESEREEGEISPEIHHGEGNFLNFEDSGMEKIVGFKNSSELIYQAEAKERSGQDNLNANNNNGSAERYRNNISKVYEPAVDASVSEDDGGNNAEESSYEHSGKRKCANQGFKSDRNWVVEMADADMYKAEGTSEPLSTFFTEISKPFAEHLPKQLHEGRGSRIFYGNSSFYLLFRLHQILYDRILSSKINASSTETRLRTLKKANPPTHYSK